MWVLHGIRFLLGSSGELDGQQIGKQQAGSLGSTERCRRDGAKQPTVIRTRQQSGTGARTAETPNKIGMAVDHQEAQTMVRVIKDEVL